MVDAWYNFNVFVLLELVQHTLAFCLVRPFAFITALMSFSRTSEAGPPLNRYFYPDFEEENRSDEKAASFCAITVGSMILPVVPISVARWQNLIPSFPWIAPGWRAWGAIQGKEGIKFCSAA